MENPQSIIYQIDGQDRITFVNLQWDRFAAANDAGDLVARQIASRSLWDFITDNTTRQLYRDILKQAREGRRIRFPFRCDSADCRRFLEMEASLVGNGGVEFNVRTLSIEKRPPQALLDPAVRSGPLLRICGWCKKIPIGVRWVEIEEAISEMHLFENAALPRLTHGICEECEKKIDDTLKAH